MLTRAELRSALDALEAATAAGQGVAAEQIDSIAAAAYHWSRERNEAAPLKRLGRLSRTMGDSAAAADYFAAALPLAPNDRWIVMGLASSLDDLGKTDEAMELVRPLLKEATLEPAILARAATFCRKLGDEEGSLVLRRRASRLDSKHRAAFLLDLTTSERAQEALAEARGALDAGINGDAELAFRCYVALSRFSRDEAELRRASAAFEVAVAHAPDGVLWLSRYQRRQNRIDEALMTIKTALSARPGDAALRRELAWCALGHGFFGRDAQILLDARRHLGGAIDLRQAIADVDDMLQALGGSLEKAAGDPAFAAIRSPESVFDHVVDSATTDKSESRRGIVMIGATLAAGGAERVLATCFRHIKDDKRFDWAKLYVIDISPETNKDFYLKDTGLDRAEVTQLNRDCRPEAPLSWLGDGRGRNAQCILNQLLIDKPAIVHVWLEPLAVLGGLAALLAGVPRIVLHTHNMRPTALSPDDPFVPRLRGCYSALLRRPEVIVVCCADAAAADYAEWIGINDATRIVAVHNGFDADAIAGAGQSKEELRGEYGYGPSNIVIGTAFRFSDVKRPFRWVETAELILKERPECRFLMFGGGDLHQATLEVIQAKGLGEYFILTGLIDDVYRRLPAMDMFMLSSRNEALPNVLLEAQAAGIPVLAYDVGGVRETMIDGETGVLVKEDTAEALARGALSALDDPVWLQRAGGAGRAFVRREFSVERMMERLTAILLAETAVEAQGRSGRVQ